VSPPAVVVFPGGNLIINGQCMRLPSVINYLSTCQEIYQEHKLFSLLFLTHDMITSAATCELFFKYFHHHWIFYNVTTAFGLLLLAVMTATARAAEKHTQCLVFTEFGGDYFHFLASLGRATTATTTTCISPYLAKIAVV
jgi:hypothetical protein